MIWSRKFAAQISLEAFRIDFRSARVLYLGGRSPLRADHGLAEGRSISRYERGRKATDAGNGGSAIVSDACPVPILEVQ